MVIDGLMTIIPLAIISWVLFLLFKQTFKKYAVSNIILAISFVIFGSFQSGKSMINLNKQV